MSPKNISVGDYLLSVDRVKIDRTINLDEQLENKVGKRVVFSFSSSPDGANPHDTILKPISTGGEKQLLYRQWVEANRAYVAKISGGKLVTFICPICRRIRSNNCILIWTGKSGETRCRRGHSQ